MVRTAFAHYAVKCHPSIGVSRARPASSPRVSVVFRSGSISARVAIGIVAEIRTAVSQSPEIKRQVFTGLGWTAGSQVFQVIGQIGFTAVLSRLLLPHAFGLMVLMSVFTGFGSLFVDFGLSSAIVQREQLEERHLSSAFWLNLASGSALMLVIAGIAPLIADFYGEPQLLYLTLALSPVFLIGSLAGVPYAIAQRAMQFRRLVLVENSAFLAGSVLAIVMAVTGFGVWSLLASSVFTTTTKTGLLWAVQPWRPSARLDRRAVRDLWAFSGHLAAFRAMNYWARNADNLLIGRFVGTNPLAYYSRAYNLTLFPLESISSVTTRVIYPTLSRMQDDQERTRSVYLRSLRLIALVTFPALIGLAVLASPFVLTLYGGKWAGVIPLLQVLSAACLLQTVTRTTGWIFSSQGATRGLFRLGVVSSLAVIASFFIGLPWGAKGVAIAYTVCCYALFWPTLTIAGRLIGLTFAHVVRALQGVLTASLVMGTIVFLVDRSVASQTANWTRLVVGVPLGMISYWMALRLVSPSSYRELQVFVAGYTSRRLARASAVKLNTPG